MTIDSDGFMCYAPEDIDQEEQELDDWYREQAEEREYESHRCDD